VPHFTCIGATRASVADTLDGFKASGLDRLVALRGDLPSGAGSFGEFRYATELIEQIRRHSDEHFHIEVAAYPETHPQARSPEADLRAFAAKVAAGANSAITQMFFNADAYFRFVDEVRALGISVPIVPGIMPITNSSGLMRFADNSGCEIPRWIRLRLQAFGDDTSAIKAFGLDVMAALCERLIAGGAPSLHFYTMNQAGATMALAGAIS
jgi:methylenetetrahydrofolate reductase (NADPH)